ncbi:MAG: hypothetical protein AABX39_05915, partial [Nanoarchaeota archaeon]
TLPETIVPHCPPTPTPVGDTCTDTSRYGFPVSNPNNLPNSCKPTDNKPGWDCYTFQEAQCNPSLRCFCIAPPEQA